MKKKSVIFVICVLSILFILSGVYAADTNSSEENQTKTEKAFSCLEEQLKDDCSGATTVQQLALAVLASPPGLTKECIAKLEAKKRSENCFGDNSCSIRDTALAILALDHAGKNTDSSEDWLIAQNRTASEVEWFLQEDSEGQTSCDLTYDSSKYTFYAAENKKLSGTIGPCFSFAQSSYWLKLSESCYDKEFSLSCDKKFFSAWHYKSPSSSVLNVLSDTKETAALNEVKLKISSKCFGPSQNVCNYEDSVWAVLALKQKDYDIKPYLPYIISSEDTNQMYLPTAFSFLILEYDTLYGTKLIQEQINGQFWEADNSAYGKYYDTALALLALGHLNQEQVAESKKWIWYVQDTDGCWNSKNIRDTSIILWSLEKRAAPSIAITNTVTRCDEGGFFCSSELECLDGDGEILTNYDCSYFGLAKKCCSKNPIKSCSDYSGTVCSSNLVCSGATRSSLEGSCCLAECITPQNNLGSECEQMNGQCRSSCLSSQEDSLYDCSGQGTCCVAKTDDSKGMPIWLWLLLLILIILVIIGIIFRDRIKVWYYKKKTGFKKDKNGGDNPRPPMGPMPPRPGFPPLRRPMMMRPMPPRPGFSQQRAPLRPGTNQKTEDAFKKLKEMTK